MDVPEFSVPTCANNPTPGKWPYQTGSLVIEEDEEDYRMSEPCETEDHLNVLIPELHTVTCAILELLEGPTLATTYALQNTVRIIQTVFDKLQCPTEPKPLTPEQTEDPLFYRDMLYCVAYAACDLDHDDVTYYCRELRQCLDYAMPALQNSCDKRRADFKRRCVPI